MVEIPVEARFEPMPASATAAGWRLVDVTQAPDDAAGGLRIALFRDESEGYYLNLTTAEPSIFVMWRIDASPLAAPDPVAATFSYNEAARWLDAGERVDRVPMPPEVAAWLAEFVQRHYRPEQARKKRRGPKPSFMDRREFEQMVERERQAGDPEVGGGGDADAPPSGGSRGPGGLE
ncbi:MAG TPA: DUF3305 domain-containing protein [Burkholderiaceae bacterium]|nr:DUF3305 domain-containing protein [Burkholderiaceae bacterium]